jgi:inosose dehydratase
MEDTTLMAINNPRLAIGHTGITWKDDTIEDGVKCIAGLGFHNIEIFAWVLKSLKEQGRSDICEKYGIPLISSYYSNDIANPDVRETELAKISEWTDIVASMGGKYATFGGNFVNRRQFNFNERKKYLVDFVNDAAKLIADKGMRLNFHPHTGTPVETESEIRSFMDAVDSRYVGFAPDIGQIQKGGSDPLRIVKDYASILRLVHFKDFCGTVKFDAEGKEIDTSGFACYSPLGQGVVDLVGILEFLEQSGFDGPVMVELDNIGAMPMSAEQAVTINKNFLEKLGYRFVKR